MTKEQLEEQLKILWWDALEAYRKFTACQRGVCDEKNALVDEQMKSINDKQKWEDLEMQIKRFEQAQQNEWNKVLNPVNQVLISLDTLNKMENAKYKEPIWKTLHKRNSTN